MSQITSFSSIKPSMLRVKSSIYIVWPPILLLKLELLNVHRKGPPNNKSVALTVRFVEDSSIVRQNIIWGPGRISKAQAHAGGPPLRDCQAVPRKKGKGCHWRCSWLGLKPEGWWDEDPWAFVFFFFRVETWWNHQPTYSRIGWSFSIHLSHFRTGTLTHSATIAHTCRTYILCWTCMMYGNPKKDAAQCFQHDQDVCEPMYMMSFWKSPGFQTFRHLSWACCTVGCLPRMLASRDQKLGWDPFHKPWKIGHEEIAIFRVYLWISWRVWAMESFLCISGMVYFSVISLKAATYGKGGHSVPFWEGNLW